MKMLVEEYVFNVQEYLHRARRKQIWVVWKIFELLFKCRPHKMVKHTQTICRLLPTSCLSVCDHFMGLVLKGLKSRSSRLWVFCKKVIHKKFAKFTRKFLSQSFFFNRVAGLLRQVFF